MSFTTTHQLPFASDHVWAWHTRPGALIRLTAPFGFATAEKQTTDLRAGTSVLRMAPSAYSVFFPGGFPWVARHVPEAYVEGQQFADEFDSSGLPVPFTWTHVHRFTRVDEATTRLTDSVNTPIPGRFLRPIFAYQQQLLQDLLSEQRLAPLAPDHRLTIAITGSHGLVGKALAAQLGTLGHRVIPLVRGEATVGERHWDLLNPTPDLLRGVNALIHLAGETIFGRFTENHQRAIMESRVGPTEKLADVVAHTDSVRVMVSGSAIGFYGADRGDEPVTEDAARGEGFLADVAEAWENATLPAQAADHVRVVNLRTGVVLAGAGGMLPLLKLAFSTGFGGPLGGGAPWLSWIALDDLTDLIIRAVYDDTLTGPLNAVAPHAVQQREFASTLGTVMKRPAVLPIPDFGPKVLLGADGARELALANQHVLPTKAEEAGHQFRYPTLEAALRHELGHESLA
ncbi:MAG: TIGR01777 family oxidoreductase [Corynebacterium sp.]|nr:TIGR01777 family oxidoreductase [Corynebacterium sp.]